MEALLVTIDIEALYSSIPHDLGINIVSIFLHERDKSQWPMKQFVLSLLRHILMNNIYRFDDQYNKQIQGVVMGARCAPLYANLFLGGWERDLFSNKSYEKYLTSI